MRMGRRALVRGGSVTRASVGNQTNPIMAANQEEKKWEYNVACMGAGYVGAPTMAVMAKYCPNVRFMVCDISQRQIDAWNSDSLPIYEPGLEDVIKVVRDRNLWFTTDIPKAIETCDMIFVAVNTPTKTTGAGAGEASDLKNWEKAARMIQKIARSSKIVVEKSTLPVRTASSMQKILDSNEHGVEHIILSNPEFLAEGTAIVNLENPDRVLIGGGHRPHQQEAVQKLASLYRNWIDQDDKEGRIVCSNVWSAELSKLVANAFLAQRISSINSISALCERTGADVQEVGHAIGMDSRIGSKFLSASVGFGGSCFQKDILNLVYLCDHFGLPDVASYWRQVVNMNNWQKRRFVSNMIQTMFDTVADKKICLFGFAFKKDTGDTRESAAIDICRFLLEERARITIYDPKVKEQQIRQDLAPFLPPKSEFDDYITVCSTPQSAVADAHAIAVMTEWDCFKDYDYSDLKTKMCQPSFIFDGRNILNHELLRDLGFNVYAIGKPLPERIPFRMSSPRSALGQR